MRVLWFTNTPLPQVMARAGRGSEGFGGHWMTELFRSVAGRVGVKLGVATAFTGLPELQFEEDGATFFALPQRKRAPTFTASGAQLARCAAVVREFAPDLIHIHGSERFFGLIKAEGLTNVPTVVSLQGMLGPYCTFRNYFGALSLLNAMRSTRLVELPLGLGLWWQYVDMRRGARQEARILAAVDGLLGRTAWDRAYGRELNPRVPYQHVGELLRPSFHATRWTLRRCERHTLIYTNAGHPRRGTENLLAAAARLASEFPQLKLRLAGVVSERSGYGRFLRRLVRRLGLTARVEFLGYLDGEAMAAELVRANAFVLSSYIENSPNSLAEAMLVGMPCIASYVGGIPSMLTDGQTGLLYPVDDVALLAERIREVFSDDDGAMRMGAAAHEVARLRHDPGVVSEQLLSAYATVIGKCAAAAPKRMVRA